MKPKLDFNSPICLIKDLPIAIKHILEKHCIQVYGEVLLLDYERIRRLRNMGTSNCDKFMKWKDLHSDDLSILMRIEYDNIRRKFINEWENRLHDSLKGDYISQIEEELPSEIEKDNIWKQRRYELAKDIVLSAATNIEYLTEIQKRGWGHTELAEQAVKYADALIEELRKEE